MSETMELATFGGGCFWCVEAVFLELKGVRQAVSGYAGGESSSPTYEEICGGHSGHAEVVQIQFDPNIINYLQLLQVFFDMHDPTTLNRQGNDVGSQYRSVIFVHNSSQREAAREMVLELESSSKFSDPIVTEIEPLLEFFVGEDYHQNYFSQHNSQPYCHFNIIPKLDKLKQKYTHLLKIVE